MLWGCALAGFPSLTVAIPPKYEPTNAVVQKLLGVVAQIDARHLVASSANVPPLRPLLPERVALHDVARLDTQVAPEGVPITPAAGSDVLFYQLTSGSTGTPKCIPERHAAVIGGGDTAMEQGAFWSS